MRSKGKLVPVEKLKVGDLIDLAGDPYADPKGNNPTFEFEYVNVGDLYGESAGEQETPKCYRLDYDGGSCGFPTGHRVRKIN